MPEKKKVIVCFVILGIVFLAFISFPQDNKPRHAPNALPGVKPQMLTAEYWIGLQKDADKVIMTPGEIERFNERIRNKRVDLSPRYGKPNFLEDEFIITEIKGPVMNPLLPLKLPETLPGDSLKVRLKSNVEWLYSRDFYDHRNVIYNETMKQEIVDKMNINEIPDGITRRFGVIVKHGNVRHYPTAIPGYSDIVNEMDLFQATAVLTGNPVAVLHKSLDGDFLYVESPISRGWMATDEIAFADREEIRKLTEDKNFLMATANKVPIYGDPSFKNFTSYFYFSATLPLKKHDGRGYIVKMPLLKPDSSLGLTDGYVKPDADVNIGYLPYTKRNVLIQIFKLLNQPYGWADQNNQRDCSGTMRVLFLCFGIKTGRHPSFILSASDHQVFMDPKQSTDEKIKEASEIEPVITLAGTYGHIVLFLGKARNGKLYFMHQCGWGYKNENGDHLYVDRVTVNCAEHEIYSIHSPQVFTTLKL